MENEMYTSAMQAEEMPFPSAAQKTGGKLHAVRVVLCVIGILLGLLCVLNAFLPGVFFGFDCEAYTYYVSAVAFGGDFYTEIHDATSTAANNIGDVAYILRDVAKMIQVMAGGTAALLFGVKLCDLIEKRNAQ